MLMSAKLKSWARPEYEEGGGDAFIFYVIYGSFPGEIQISRAKYRTEGLPPGITLRKLTRAEHPVLPFTDSFYADILRDKNPNLFILVEAAPECLILKGTVFDPPDLDYLRDCIGVLTFLMDSGGIAVADIQQLDFYDSTQWREEFFESENLRIHRHVAILYSDEKSGRGRWFHTRGLRKFGRPDLSLHNIPAQHEDAAIDLCNRLIALQAAGGRISQGQKIRMDSLPAYLSCHHEGSLDDPDFNNVHVEMRFQT